MKKNIWKRLVSLALALVMVAGWLPHMATEAHAAGTIKLEGDSFTTDPGQGFTFKAYYYCGVCEKYSYPNQPADTNHSIEITSFSYEISQGNISYTYGYKVKGCDGESTGSYSNNKTFDCSQNNKGGTLYTPSGLSTSHAVAVVFFRSKSAHSFDQDAGDGVCKVCGGECEHTDKTAATCIAAEKCNACGKTIGNSDPNAHNYTWTYENGNHNGVCSYNDGHTTSGSCAPGEDGNCTVCHASLVASVHTLDKILYFTDADAALEYEENNYANTVTILKDATVNRDTVAGNLVVKPGVTLTFPSGAQIAIVKGKVSGGGTIGGQGVTLEVEGGCAGCTFDMPVQNCGNVTGGIFNRGLKNYGTVTGGTIHGTLKNAKRNLDGVDRIGVVHADNITLGTDFIYEADEGTTLICTHTHGTPATCVAAQTCPFNCADLDPVNPNAHSLSYAAADNVITETCAYNCAAPATATLAINTGSVTYNGAAQTIEITITHSATWRGEKLTAQYENNINVGTAKAYIEKGGVRVEQPFTINPASIADATVELQSISEKYTGGDLTPTVAVTYSGTQLAEHTDYEISWHPENVVDVGTYQIKIKGNGNFKDEATLNQTFTITRATPTAANFVLTPPTSLTYDGEEKKAEVKKATGIEGMGNVTDVHYFNSAGEEVETPTAVDTYTVKVDVAEGGNYEAIEGLAVGSYTIEKATPTFTAPAAKELTYNGQPLALVEAGSVNPGRLLYRLDDGEYSETVPTATNAGNYTVYYKVEGLDTNNYNEISSGSVSVTIRKAEAPDITFPTVLNEITFGQKLEEAKLSFYENDYGTFSWNAPTAYPGKAGTGSYALDFYPNALALQNYDWKNVGEAQWIAERNALCICPNVTVNKAAAAITTVPTPNDLTYNGEDQPLVTAGSVTGGTMVYSLEMEGEYTETLPQAMDVDTYTVWYKVVGDSNHNDIEPDFVSVEIKKANASVDAPAAISVLVYNGREQELVIPVVSMGGTVYYSLDGVTYTDYVPKGINAQEYTVYYKVVGDANHNDIEPKTVTAKIAPWNIETASCKAGVRGEPFTYNGQEHTPDVQIVAWVNDYPVPESPYAPGADVRLTKDTDYTVTYSDNVNAGQAVVTFTGKGNYTGTITGNFTIAPKPITVTIADKTSVYGEAMAELTAATDGIVNNDTNVYSLATDASSTANVGTYPITGTALDANYTITFVNGTYTITKALAVATAPTAVSGLIYNTAPQTLIATGSTNDGNIVYSLDKDGEYKAELPQATAAGTYHVWYKVIGDGNHTDSAPADLKVKIDKAYPGIGAVTAGVVNDTLATSAIVLTRANTDIPGTLTVDAEQTLVLGENPIRYTFTPNDTANYKVVTDEVTVSVADTIAPTGTVTVSTKSWAEFLNDITFGLFFKETQTVSVTADDNLSGVAKIEYIESKTAMNLDAVKAATQWTEMKNGSVSVTASDAKQFIYYIRITDKSGNVAFLSSDGAEYDTTAPVIAGVDNGVTYYTTQNVTVTDKNIDTITLNGETATGSISLAGNKEATYTIVATDKAGNSTTVTVKMAPISDITAPVDGKSEANVTSDDKTNLQTIVDTVTELLKDEDMTAEEKAALEKAKDDAEALIEVIEDTANTQKAVTDKEAEYDEDAVKSTDKAELEELAADIDALLDTENLTQDEQAALETLLEQVEDMIDTINATAADRKAATETVDSYDPATVTSSDKAAIESALDTIEDLLDTKHLTGAERDALEDAKADAEALLDAIDEATKAADTANTAKVEDVTADNVTPEDKSDLEKAKDDLEDALEKNGGNYTEEEKKAIEDEIKRIEDALETLENVEAIEDAISDLPATVEPDDEETVAKIEEAKKAYDELTDYEKSLVDEKVKEKLDKLTAAAVAYDIVKGDGGKWSVSTASGLSFTANGPISKFVSVEIDGKVIDTKHYSVKAGSTIITLNASYLETLSVGTHTITVVYSDGETEGTFKINPKSAPPATGDDFNILLWTSVMIVSLAAIAVLLIEQKKRR